jgi:hypothetical protein
MPYQFIHIGKTGGSLMRAVLESLPEPHRSQFLLHGHRIKLAKAVERYPDMPVFFSVRRTSAMCVSGFNSRRRQGQPTYSVPWTPEERVTFSLFESPNELAEALSSNDRHLKESAESAMVSSEHIRRGLAWNLGGIDALERHKGSIVFILLQEQLEQDLRTFMEGVGVPPELAGVSPQERMHTSMAEDETALSDAGLANIRKWFSAHAEIYDWCAERHDAILESWETRPAGASTGQAPT